MASNLGRIKRLKRIVNKRTFNEKILKPCLNPHGYEEVCISILGNKSNYRVHRLVAEAFLENKENKPCVNHKNSNKSDNRLENLEWCTSKENNIHAFAYGNGNTKKGVESNFSKLNEEEVTKIYYYIKHSDLYQKDIARIFGITRQLVSKIKTKKAWKELTDMLDSMEGNL